MISIIVPVYNKEKYVKSCVHSLLKQTFSDIEIILIDDGSTDNSLEVCYELMKIDKRIRVYHFDNSGVSTTRNKGIELANGEYLFFMDADDHIPTNTIENIYKKIECDNSDIVIGSMSFVYPHATTYNKVENKFYSLQNNENINKVLINLLESVCGKLFKKELIVNNNIRFPENIKASEDAYFLNSYLLFCNAITTISKVTYEYNKMDDTSTTFKYYKDFNKWNRMVLEKEKLVYKKWCVKNDYAFRYISDKASTLLKDCTYLYSIREKDENESIHLIEQSYYMFKDDIDFKKNRVLKKELINMYINSDFKGVREYFVSESKGNFFKRYIFLIMKPFKKLLIKIRIKRFISYV